MSIRANIQSFFSGINQEIHQVVDFALEDQVDQDVGVFSSLKNYTIQFIDITQKVCKKAVIYYPKTMLVALIVSTVCALVFASIASLFVFGINFYFFAKYENLIFTAIRMYDVANVSEWFAPIAEKQRMIALIQDVETVRGLFQMIGDRFR